MMLLKNLKNLMNEKLIVDIDNTICNQNGDYKNSKINKSIVLKLREYKKKDLKLFFTSRNMRTYKNNLGKINLYTIPVLVDWINDNDVPCDELYVGKPWCGFDGFYIDDKSIRPSEFINKDYDEILQLIK